MVLALMMLGLAAGALTTLAGMGGGVMLVLTLSLVIGPKAALVATAPALLFGNAHRLWLFRRDVDRRVGVPFVAGALPGSLVGGFLLPHLPTVAISWMMVGLTALGLAKVLKLVAWTPPRTLIAPASFVVGGLSATAGGAGVLAAPVLMASGLTGAAYVATGAAGAIAMHAGRILSYGVSGLLTRETALTAGILTATILAGNLVGKHLRARLGDLVSGRIEIATLVASVGLAIVGAGR